VRPAALLRWHGIAPEDLRAALERKRWNGRHAVGRYR
jgi:hypothetical protein